VMVDALRLSTLRIQWLMRCFLRADGFIVGVTRQAESAVGLRRQTAAG
jgi:hypothetical protein